MPQDIGGLLPCQTTPLVSSTNLARAMLMPMHYPTSGGLRPWKINAQAVHAVCEGVHAPHGKVETLCHGAQVVDALSQDNAPPGMASLEWCQAQSKDPSIHQIIDGIQNKTIGKLKIHGDMPSELKALIRLKKAIGSKCKGFFIEGPLRSMQKPDSN